MPPEATTPWWVSPVGINLGFLLPMLVLIVYADQADLEGLTLRGVDFLTTPYIYLGAALLLITALGGWIGTQLKIERRERGESLADYERAAIVIGVIALCSYMIWFKDFLLNPVLLLKTLTGAYRPDRTNISLSVGITSLVNTAPAFLSIYASMYLDAGRPRRLLRWMFIAIICFTLFRVYAWSERLALIEATVPLGMVAACRLNNSRNALFRWVATMGPYVALPFLLLYFGIAESARAWTSATYNQKLGFWQFVTGRLASYYYSSLNNGAGVLATSEWPSYHFENTLDWLHRAPLLGRLFSAAVDLKYFELERFLTSYGDPEFNNPSGLYGVIYDLGLPLGFAYFAVAGFFGGVLLRAYQARRWSGVLLYPMFFLFYLEVFRYPYFGSSRAFTWMLGIILATVVAHGIGHRKRNSMLVGSVR
jgi:oligosaccharide repeat unit polymerase